MNEDLINLEPSPILPYNYAQRFQEVPYNGYTLSDSERKDFIAIIDEEVSKRSVGLNMIRTILESSKDYHDEFHEVERTILSIMLFVSLTMMDSMVASKYFLIADKDYDRRYMRGKLFVIFNEGFKKLYGFDEKTYKKSEWDRLLPLMKYFPEVINLQYQELTYHLEKLAKSSSWWKEERNLETHMDAVKLLASRQEEIIESKVMIDSSKLLNSLLAVDDFLTNVHKSLNNYLKAKIKLTGLSK